jgi:hypothetical protein
MRRVRSTCCALAAMGQVAVAQFKTRKKVRRFTTVRQHVARKQEGQTIRFPSASELVCALWLLGFTTPGLPPPTDILVGRLGAVKECQERSCASANSEASHLHRRGIGIARGLALA